MSVTGGVVEQPDDGSQRSDSFRLSGRRRWSDQVAQRLLGLIAGALCLLVVGVAAALLLRSLPLLSTFSLFELWGGQVWQPMRGLFGYAPFVVGSLWVTAVAMAVAVVPAVFSGIYLAEYVSERSRSLLKPLLDLLVGIPSVVYGVWGVLFVVPLVRRLLQSL